MSRYRIGMTIDAAGGWLTFAHVEPIPVSSWQVALHPSPETVLPSSHCSPGKTRPSPQTPVHPPAPLHFASIVHVGEQPSYGIKLPSSHCSKPSLIPSPHVVLWHVDLGGIPAITHAKPGSRVH